MGPESAPETDLMLRAVDGVQDSTTLEDALHAMVAVLQARFELWHANFAFVPSTNPSARILASWSMTESVFDPGTEVATSISPTLQELFQDLHEGEIAIVEMDRDSGSLVDHLLREQGVASIVAVPVHRDSSGLLILTLGSSAVGPLHEMGARFFHGLGAGIRDRVCALAAPQSA